MHNLYNILSKKYISLKNKYLSLIFYQFSFTYIVSRILI